MQHPSSRQHAGGGHDDRRVVEMVEGLRLFDAANETNVSLQGAHRVATQPVIAVVFEVEVGGANRHRAVEVDGERRDSSGVDELVEQIDDGLGAADGEGRDEHHTSAIRRLVNHLLEDVQRIVVFVDPIPIGRLAHQLVWAESPFRGIHDGIVRPAHITGEDDPAMATDANHGRAEDVTCRNEFDRQSADVERVMNVDGDERGQRIVGVLFRVERKGRAMFGGPFLVGVLGVLFLQMTGVGQQDAGEVHRRWGGIDRPGVSLFDEPRQISGVVEVGVGEHDGVDRRRIDGKRRPVSLPKRLVALKEATVDDDSGRTVFDQILRPGDGSRGAQKRDLHAHSLPSGYPREMEYTKLGSSGLEVSRIALGCMSYGTPSWRPWVLDAEAAKPFFQRALELGITFFDTADMYSLGVSEEVTGRWLRAYADLDEIVIATKVFFPMGEGPNMGGLSRKHIVQACEASLRRLGVETIDLYQIHRYDPTTPIDETLAALDHLVRQGKVRYIGASSMYAYQLMRALSLSEQNGWAKFVSMQNHYNLLYREEEREMAPLCREEGIGMIPWSPLARGLLAGTRQKVGEGSTPRSTSDGLDRLWYSHPADGAVVAAVKQVAAERGIPPAQVALSWLLSRPGVVAPIVGATKLRHLDDAVAALDVHLTAEEVQRLEDPYRPHSVIGMEPPRSVVGSLES